MESWRCAKQPSQPALLASQATHQHLHFTQQLLTTERPDSSCSNTDCRELYSPLYDSSQHGLSDASRRQGRRRAICAVQAGTSG